MSKFKNLVKTVNKVIAENATAIPFEERFLKDFNTALVKLEEERQQAPAPDGYFRPSSIYGCERMLYFVQKGVQVDAEQFDPILIGICEAGTDRHARIQSVVANMQRMGYPLEILDLEEEVRKANMMGINTEFMGWNSDRTEARCRNSDLHIYFQPDGVFKYLDKKCLLEIKTETMMTFNKRTEPKPEHMNYQATCYAMGTGIDNVLFIYEDRNFTNKKAYLVMVTQEMKDNVFNKIMRVLWHVENNQIPAKELDKCKYCRYKSACNLAGDTVSTYGG